MGSSCFFVKLRLLFFMLLLLPGAGIFCEEEAPKPGDFAGAYGLTGQEGSLLRLELPVEVFMGAERADLGDLRIFDSAGVSAPYIIREPPVEMATPPPREIPFFVWKQGDEKTLLSGTDIEINTSGGVVQIKNQSQSEGSPPVYLADLSAFYQEDQEAQQDQPDGSGEAPAELLIKTAHGGRFFNTPVTLHYSFDLSHWRNFDKKQVLAFYGSAGANRDTLTLPRGERFRYLLIRMEPGAPPPEKMIARFDPAPVPAEIREKSIQGDISGDGKTAAYHTGGFYPAFEIDFFLPAPDSLEVTIWSRRGEDEDWNGRGRETIFRYNTPGGEIRKNSPFAISGAGPFWEIRISGERIFTVAPEMVIRWKMRELIFLALGKGPWTLAYGNAAFGPPAEGLPRLEQGAELLPALPTGMTRYEPRPKERVEIEEEEEHSFGAWILWGVLILAAALLSFLAVVIARSMKNG